MLHFFTEEGERVKKKHNMEREEEGRGKGRGREGRKWQRKKWRIKEWSITLKRENRETKLKIVLVMSACLMLHIFTEEGERKEERKRRVQEEGGEMNREGRGMWLTEKKMVRKNLKMSRAGM